VNPAERPVSEDDLTAWVDGRLEPARVAPVEAFLATHPEDAARLRSDRETRATLRDRLAAKALEPVPSRLRVATIVAERRRAISGRLTKAAVILLVFAGGVAGGWLARDRIFTTGGGGQAMVAEALAAHRTFAVEVVHPVEVKAAEETHLAQWLSKRLGRKLVIPDLESAGLQLMGGRLLPAGREIAAQLMYGDAGGARVTLYVRSGESGPGRFRVVKEGALSSVAWVDGGFGYALSGPVDPDRLVAAARAAHSEMDGPHKSPL
jgi:anti-sigma factor RsiW